MTTPPATCWSTPSPGSASWSVELTDGLSDEDWRPTGRTPEANSIAWLIWHLTRVQDDHVAGLAGCEQAWPALAGPVRPAVRRLGHRLRPERRARWPRSGSTGELLAGYHADVHELTLALPGGDHRRRTGPGGRHPMGPAGHRGRATGQRARRRPPAPRPGRLRTGPGRAAQPAVAGFRRGGSVVRCRPAPLLRRPCPVVAADLHAGGVRRGGGVRRLAAAHFEPAWRAAPGRAADRARTGQRRRQQRVPPEARVRPHPGRPVPGDGGGLPAAQPRVRAPDRRHAHRSGSAGSSTPSSCTTRSST